MFTGFSHVMMWTKDIDRALKWYTEKLGCQVNFVHLPHYASLRLEQAGVRIDLHPSDAQGRDVGFGPMPYFQVKDVDEALKQLAARGIKVGEAQTEGGSHKFATFWDSEGNALGIQQA
ncbi:MAG: VOC family protein [Planctomycetes bacterium]|nr:VOC family protein [Planctomycetota bacterium]MCB9934798.1 VOC family protein [Planctomycetota bacterium]